MLPKMGKGRVFFKLHLRKMPVSTSVATCLHCKPDFHSRAITLSEFFVVENSSRNVIFLNHLKHINIGMVAKICPYK